MLAEAELGMMPGLCCFKLLSYSSNKKLKTVTLLYAIPSGPNTLPSSTPTHPHQAPYFLGAMELPLFLPLPPVVNHPTGISQHNS